MLCTRWPCSLSYRGHNPTQCEPPHPCPGHPSIVTAWREQPMAVGNEPARTQRLTTRDFLRGRPGPETRLSYNPTPWTGALDVVSLWPLGRRCRRCRRSKAGGRPGAWRAVAFLRPTGCVRRDKVSVVRNPRGLLAVIAVTMLFQGCQSPVRTALSPWRFGAPVTPPDVALSLLVESGGCVQGTATVGVRPLDHIEVHEAPAEVRIGAWLAPPQVARPAQCADVGGELPATVHLKAPIGSRAVVDAFCAGHPKTQQAFCQGDKRANAPPSPRP